MSKICSNCGFSNTEIAKFCLKCGNSLKSNNGQDVSCPKCGSTNPFESKFCIYCGSTLASELDDGNNNIDQKNIPVTNQANHLNEVNCPYCGESINATAEKCKHCGEWVRKRQSQIYNQYDDGQTHTIAIVLGYIFTFLGGLIGLFIAIYLLTRNNENAKDHGKIQLVLFVIMTILWIIIVPWLLR
ncbi:MAG: zinc ribbon domain-containing protein [Methanobacteriaceae archaeon]|jgi:uncharacterized membrane protein YvbJ|nr:zinc ribbon domain-containing protein [Candidatus Methanorudis spinitermitis]